MSNYDGETNGVPSIARTAHNASARAGAESVRDAYHPYGRSPRARRDLETLAQFWAALIRDTDEWRLHCRIRDAFLSGYGLTRDLRGFGIAPGSRRWKQFVLRVLRVARTALEPTLLVPDRMDEPP